jgi:hypothetical protein
MNELDLVLRGGTVVTHEGENVSDIGKIACLWIGGFGVKSSP